MRALEEAQAALPALDKTYMVKSEGGRPAESNSCMWMYPTGAPAKPAGFVGKRRSNEASELLPLAGAPRHQLEYFSGWQQIHFPR